PGSWGRADWRPGSLLRSIERSLARPRTDHVDLIQLHSCSLAELRKGDVIEALERARERGLARDIGYSGDGEAARHAVECGRFDTLQTSVSLADQEAIDLTLPLTRARGWASSPSGPSRTSPGATRRSRPNPTIRRTGLACASSITPSCEAMS